MGGQFFRRGLTGGTLGARLADRRTVGFDYLRLTLSLIVILSHSVGIVLPDMVVPPWFALFKRIAIPLFFALSGFLVASSLDRANNLRVFLTNRLLRIFPALTVEVTLSALVLGPLLTTMTLAAYVRDPRFATYFFNVVGYIHYYLPGVFEVRAPHEVNRSLWTVPSEFECYVLLAAIYLVGMFRYTWALFAALALLTAWCLWQYTGYDFLVSPNIPARVTVACFLAGNIVYKVRDRLPGGAAIAWSLVALSYVMLANVTATILAPLVIAYAAAALGCTAPRRAPIILSGDYSYGLYLYAMPIQQTIITLFGPMAVAVHYIASVAITSIFAAFSWHYIEKPALALKRHFIKAKPRAEASGAPVDPETVPLQQPV